MSAKELLFSALRHEECSRVPWVPFAGVHAGNLRGYTGKEILTDSDKLVESLLAVHELYCPDGMPIAFDLQIEAEILGCELLWAEKAPPSVVSHPLEGNPSIPDIDIKPTDGRLPVILDAMKRVNDAIGQQTGLYGLATGPFTLASHLRGTEIFLDSMTNPDYLNELMSYTTRVGKSLIDYYIDAGMGVIALVDPLVSQVSPKHFEQFLAKPFKALFDHIRSRNVFSSFFVCGNATKNIEPMCLTNPDCIAVDENIDMVRAKEITDRYNITLSGNVPLSTHMLLGTQQDNMKFVVDLLDMVSHHNLIISPGCDMPYDTPVENTIGVMQAVREPDKMRELVKNYQAPEIDIEVDLPDYDRLEKPLIEVFTIDSETCAACGYMVKAAQNVVAKFDGQVEMVEYKSTRPENIARLKKMQISNLPCMYVNGEMKFSSIIPSSQELIDIIERFLR